MDLHTWIIYLLAATGLSLSPGPNGLLALTHGALYGSRRTLWTISGGVIGFAILIGASIFGIGVLLQASATALTVMKWLGGAYLVWLGIQVWRAPPVGVEAIAAAPPRAGWSMFRQGALSALTNPKGLLFFVAFLPQFVPANSPAPAASLLLFGLWFVVQNLVYMLALVALAARLRRVHAPPVVQRVLNALGGVLFFGLALRLLGARPGVA